MEGKKSFVLYSDVKTTLDLLTDEQAGQVFKYLVDYVNDLDPEVPNEPLVKLALAPIKQQLKRDLEKWAGIREKRSQAGKKSAEKRAEQAATNPTSVESVKQTPTNPTVNVIVNDTVNENVIVNDTVNESESKTLEGRKLAFAQSLNPFLEKYGKPMLIEFRDYWTEHNEQGKKMRFEMAKNNPFNLSRRLSTWAKKNAEGNFKGSGAKKRGVGVDPDYLNELENRLKG